VENQQGRTASSSRLQKEGKGEAWKLARRSHLLGKGGKHWVKTLVRKKEKIEKRIKPDN